ncbi:putative proline--tRNA ligase, mitochondrial [Xylocopa sonorina]|uniref:putative proline--tRNA ligase, mitochondrial n=1 Tax=Xylocopa sonorina TaxID=1818115 RepID=UPI00403AF1A6
MGSNEKEGFQYVDGIIDVLNQLNIDTILDDRTNLTIGKRFTYARIIGFPYVIVIGKSITEFPPMIEVHNINDLTDTKIPVNDLFSYFNDENIKKNIKK